MPHKTGSREKSTPIPYVEALLDMLLAEEKLRREQFFRENR
jgi:hypothetical protein